MSCLDSSGLRSPRKPGSLKDTFLQASPPPPLLPCFLGPITKNHEITATRVYSSGYHPYHIASEPPEMYNSLKPSPRSIPRHSKYHTSIASLPTLLPHNLRCRTPVYLSSQPV